MSRLTDTERRLFESWPESWTEYCQRLNSRIQATFVWAPVDYAPGLMPWARPATEMEENHFHDFYTCTTPANPDNYILIRVDPSAPSVMFVQADGKFVIDRFNPTHWDAAEVWNLKFDWARKVMLQMEQGLNGGH